jgi:3-methyladenine DNA glycosylase/8-oxoguanine DNA glycosylase
MNINYSDHIGAIITDAVFQAGLNYDNVVLPKVKNIFENYNEFKTVSLFLELLKSKSPENIFQNKNKAKSKTAIEVLEMFKLNQLETTDQIKAWIRKDENIPSLMTIKGVGPKTIDYLLLLL